MRSTTRHAHALAGALALTTAVGADSIMVHDLGAEPVELRPGHAGDLLDGDAFGVGALNDVSAALSADGIRTEGRVTVAPATTARGLALLVIVDHVVGADGREGPADSSLGVRSSIFGAAPTFVADAAGDVSREPGGAAGTLAWDSRRAGDGLAWGDLVHGDRGTFDFDALDALGLEEHAKTDLFQLATFDGERWAIAATAPLDADGAAGFAFAVIQLPPAVYLGFAGLAGVWLVRLGRRLLA